MSVPLFLLKRDANRLYESLPPTPAAIETAGNVASTALALAPSAGVLAKAFGKKEIFKFAHNSAVKAFGLAAASGLSTNNLNRIGKFYDALRPYARAAFSLKAAGYSPLSSKSYSSRPSRFSQAGMAYYPRRRYGGTSRRRRGLSFRAARRVPSYKRNSPLNRVSIVQRRPRVQIKQRYVNTTLTNINPSAPSVIPICGIANGTEEFEREGNNIKLLDVGIRIVMSYTSNREVAIAFPVNFRITIIKWLQGYVSPSAATIFAGGGGGDFYLAPFRQTEQKNFQVLYDRVHRNEPQAVGQLAGGEILDTFKVIQIRKVLSQYVTYNGPASTNGDHQFFMIVSPDVATNRFQFFESVRFIDL